MSSVSRHMRAVNPRLAFEDHRFKDQCFKLACRRLSSIRNYGFPWFPIALAALL